jgi:bacterioferritin
MSTDIGQNTFALDVTRIRDNARSHMSDGPVTQANTADRDRLISIFNDILATEMVCYMRYTQHSIVASGVDRAQVAAEFTENAGEELQHAIWIAERVNQLGGSPDYDPATIAERSHTEYTEVADADLSRMLAENLVAERIVISTYQEVIRWIGDADPTSRRLLEKILAQEEEHADELNTLMGN